MVDIKEAIEKGLTVFVRWRPSMRLGKTKSARGVLKQINGVYHLREKSGYYVIREDSIISVRKARKRISIRK